VQVAGLAAQLRFHLICGLRAFKLHKLCNQIKYPGQTKTSTAALRFAEGSVRARERKPQRQITWSSRLGVVRGAGYPSTENEYKLKTLNIQMDPDGLKGLDDGEDNGIRIPSFILALGT